ncbi:MAG: hypothetical protein SNJ64_01600 [Endomicrobiia bacterium]
MREFRIYKPSKDGKTGAATRLQFRPDDSHKKFVFFIESTLQIGFDKDGNAKFGWDTNGSKKITFKIEPSDIGEILSVLCRRKKYLGLSDGKGGGRGIFHKNNKSNTILNINYIENINTEPFFYYRISRKTEKELLEIKHTLSLGEAEILRVLLEHFLIMTFIK